MAKNNEKFVSRENAKTLWGYMVDLLTGKYTKPSGGIPKSDLESSVQTSLGKADSALQSEIDPTVPSWAKQPNKPSYTQDEVGDGTTYKRVSSTEKDTWNAKGTYSKPPGGIPKSDLASAVQTSLEKADSALQSETDPTVPSWAKQPNKPSYTQDEVADGSTYKRVTQTEKNTWNGKQNALTTPQMQAVNSGITSEGVAQISTNQTNILYALNKVGKNLFDFKTWVKSLTGADGGYFTYTDNSITLTATSSSATTRPAIGGFHVSVKPSTEYVLAFTGFDTNGAITLLKNDTYSGYKTYDTTVGDNVITFTTDSTTNRWSIRFDVKDAINQSSTISNVMIIPKEVYDAVGGDYQPYAAPNYELTKLESEDRAALAEVMDSGAKNVLSWSLEEAKRINTDGTWSGNVYTHNGITYTVNSDMTISISMVSGTTTHSRSVFKLSESVPNSYTNSYVLSSGNTYMSAISFALYAEETDSPWTDIAIDYGTGTIISSTAQSVYSVYIAVKADYVLSITHSVKPMICTLADWKISHRYAPYRPDWDLVGTLFPTTYTAPVVNSDISSKLSILSGGYAKAGNLITVNIRLLVTDTISADSALFTGLPVPKTTASLSYGSAVVPVTNMCVNAQVSPNVMSIDTHGTIRLAGTSVSSDITTGIYILSATYLSA